MSLSIAYQNVRGLRTKLCTFKLNVISNSHDIIFITESWLNDTVVNSELIDENQYSIFRRDRSSASSFKKEGGGVFIAVRNSLRPEVLVNFNSEAEDVWVMVRLNNIRMYLCCVYLPPGDELAAASFLSKLELNKLTIKDNILLMCGDFNCPSVRWVSQNDRDNILVATNVDVYSSRITDTFCFMELFQFNNVLNKNGKLLDLVLCTEDNVRHLMKNENPFVREDEYHPSLEFTFNVKTTHYLENRANLFTFNFKKANYDLINERFEAVDWVDVLRGDVNLRVDIFCQIVNDIVRKSVPQTQRNRKFPLFSL